MRTTIDLDGDVAKAIDRYMREVGVGRSEAVNQLVRRALVAPAEAPRYHPPAHPLGTRVDLSNVAEVLDHLDELDRDVPARPRPKRSAEQRRAG